MLATVAEIKRHLDATGSAVQANIKRIREDKRIPVTELSALMNDLGRPIPPLGLRRIESGERRVDVDDLVALAVALDVSPVTLLMPDSTSGDEQVAVSGVENEVLAQELWDWLRGNYPLPDDDRLPLIFRAAAWPQWRFNEQVEQDRKTSSAWLNARRDQKKYQELDLDGDD